MAKAAESRQLIAENRKARFDYFIEERYEAGLALQGATAGARGLPRLHVPDAYWPLGGDRSKPAYNVALVYEDLRRDLRSGSHTAPTIADAVRLHRMLREVELAT